MSSSSIQDMWFISDPHFGDEFIVSVERQRFDNAASHDDYICWQLRLWAEQHVGSILWILGDFGKKDRLPDINSLRSYVTVNFLMGNHDNPKDVDVFCKYFDNVVQYPTYLSNRVVISHSPIYPIQKGVVNVHGHLHSSILNSNQHLCVSMHEVNYTPVSYKAVAKRFNKLEKDSGKFLYESYAHLYHFTQEKTDVVMDSKHNVILEESRQRLKEMRARRKGNMETA